MTAKQNLHLTIFNTILLLIIVGYVVMEKYKSSNKILVVDNGRLFNEFKMTIETQKKGKQLIKNLHNTVDSLQIQYNINNDKTSKADILQQIITQKENIQNFNDSFTSQETMKIWGRINEYVKEYSEINGYTLILGSQNNGNVLYFNNSHDDTNNVVKFINKKYEGFN